MTYGLDVSRRDAAPSFKGRLPGSRAALVATMTGVLAVTISGIWIGKTAAAPAELSLPISALALAVVGFVVALTANIAMMAMAARRRVDRALSAERMRMTFAAGALLVLLVPLSFGASVLLLG
jgi:uncharacterized membrane protein YhaH (DUF805 family)